MWLGIAGTILVAWGAAEVLNEETRGHVQRRASPDDHIQAATPTVGRATRAIRRHGPCRSSRPRRRPDGDRQQVPARPGRAPGNGGLRPVQGERSAHERNWQPSRCAPSGVSSADRHACPSTTAATCPGCTRTGSRAEIHATTGTIALAPIILAVSAHLQEEEARFANQPVLQAHPPAAHDAADVEGTLPLFRLLGHGELARSLRASPRACRGRAHPRVSHGAHRPGRHQRRVQRRPRAIPVSHPSRAGADGRCRLDRPREHLGDRRPPRLVLHRRTRDVIERTIARRGTVVIPAFASIGPRCCCTSATSRTVAAAPGPR